MESIGVLWILPQNVLLDSVSLFKLSSPMVPQSSIQRIGSATIHEVDRLWS